MTYSEKIEQIKLYIIQVHTVLPDALKKNAGNSLFLMAIAFAFVPKIAVAELTSPLIDTMQDRCFNASGTEIDCPDRDENFFGQDAQYTTTNFSYKDNGNGTVTDLNTDLVWQKTPDFARRYLYGEAEAYCEALTLVGHDDWRLPDIKELQSIVDYEKMELPAIDESFFKISDHRIYFWSNTTHGDFKDRAAIVAFGKALGRAPDREEFTDWHGAGAQRTAPKTGDPEDYLDRCSVNACDYPIVKNLSRCVR